MRERPKKRAECVDGPRPCPWVSCRHHLAVDVTGVLVKQWGEVDEMRDTCVLDVAERGPITLDAVGSLYKLSRERVRQIELAALEKLRGRFEPLLLELLGLERAPSVDEGVKPKSKPVALTKNERRLVGHLMTGLKVASTREIADALDMSQTWARRALQKACTLGVVTSSVEDGVIKWSATKRGKKVAIVEPMVRDRRSERRRELLERRVREIVQALRHLGPSSGVTIARHLDVCRGTISRALCRAEEMGAVVRTGQGGTTLFHAPLRREGEAA